MYERFTDRAWKVLQLANQEALRLNHEYIGTEHLLLGLVAQRSGVANTVLENLNVDLRKIRREVEEIIQPGPVMKMMRKQPLTPRSGYVFFERALEESRNLGHNDVDTEHLLLGLIREEDGVAGQILRDQGLTLEAVRAEVLRVLEQSKPPENPY